VSKYLPFKAEPSEEREFQPDWASPPGETIAQVLERQGLSPLQFAERIGRTAEEAEQLLIGNEKITVETAQKLERLLGGSAAFWMIRESHYREDQARLASDVVPDTQEQWLSDLPLSDMQKFGWIKPISPSGAVEECLRFFDTRDFRTWREKYGRLLRQAAFRTSRSFPANPSATAAWLRQAEVEAKHISCGLWDAGRFGPILATIRELTRKREPDIFLPELRKWCAECGVAVVFLPAPTGCRASGATRFLSSEKALLLLSFRHLSDDHFWFTFFHEAAHLLLHGRTAVFLEGQDLSRTKEEDEANDFAADVLVPKKFQEQMLSLPVNGFDVIRFAKLVGVSPGIIVGQLQFYGHFTHRQLNNLKRRFAWKPKENGSS
jgi:HTH-type transcriptional regulator/antitoxin HigA